MNVSPRLKALRAAGFCLSFGLAALHAGQRAEAVVVLLDPYTVSANSFDANFEINRQSGSLAPITYTQVGNANHHQVGNPGSSGRLLIADVGGASQGRVSLDRNFNDLIGTNFISFDVDPVNPNSPAVQGSWAAINLGTSAAGRNQFVNASDGFGILFRGNGAFQAFDGGGQVGIGTYTLAPTGLHHIDLRILDLDGNPWNGVGGTTIQAFADGALSPFFSFTKGGGGYTNNFITLQGNTDGGGIGIHDFDNLTIGVETPEPATMALLGLGGLAMMARRRRA